jgi:hypothetical protein
MAPRRPLTAFEKTIPDYRKRILISFARALIVPPLLTSFVLHLICRSVSLSIYLPLALLSIPFTIAVRSRYALWSQDSEAARMDAKPITRVRGRWPGNLDIVLRLLKSFESGYVLQGFADLFAEYGCTTLNTRFFWDDQVSAASSHLISRPGLPILATHGFIDHLHGREGLPIRGAHRLHTLREGHSVARADVRLSSVSQRHFHSPSSARFPLTAINFWERASSMRAYYDASSDCLYAQPSPAKEIGGGSCVALAFFFPLSIRTYHSPLSLLCSQGRQIARPFFTKERISDFHIFDQTSAKALNLLSNRAAAYAPIDVQDLLQRFTLDSAALFLWGHALNTLDLPLTQPGRVVLGPKGSAPADGGGEWDVFTNAFESVAVLITRRGVQGDTWPLLELFKDKTEEPIQVIMDWLEPLVRRALDRKAKRMEASAGDAKVSTRDEDTVFLDYLADQTDGGVLFFASWWVAD